MIGVVAATKSRERALLLTCGVFLYGAPALFASHYPNASAGWIALNTLALPVMAVCIIAAEQLIVAIVARALGDYTPFLTFGVGPVVFDGSIRSCKVSVRAVPYGAGSCIATTRTSGQIARAAIATGAGLVVSGGIVALVVAASPMDLARRFGSAFAPDAAAIMAGGFVCFVSASALLGALVSPPNSPLHKARRVMGHMVESFEQSARGAYAQAEASARRGLEEAPDELALQLALAQALISAGDSEGAAVIGALLARDLPPAARHGCLNLLAWDYYLAGKTELREEADRASREALEGKPDDPSYLDTRGHVALWSGRHAEAEEYLQRSHRLARTPSTRASSATGLAMVYATMDRGEDAARWLDVARQADPNHRLLPRATAMVEPLRRI
jgi:tetratricopeptide (TPR) repeat protein